jgi:multidrug efflux pump subunit AcrA (membrane-fusion protein)
MTYAVAEVENPFKSNISGNRPPLNIGLFVEAEIAGKTITDAVTIPKTAVYRGNEILILNKDNEIHYQLVSVVQTQANSITAVGLTPGMRIVSSRIPLAINGMKVSPQKGVLAKSQNADTEEPIL